MSSETQIPLKKFTDEFELENLTHDIDIEERMLKQKFVNRPALQLTGFFDHFDNTRIQIIGRIEHTYMKNQSKETRIEILDKLFSYRFPCMVFCKSLLPFSETFAIAEKYSVPIFGTSYGASELYSEAIRWLNTEFAEKITMHGVLVDVYGVGLLIIGESGIGKSEAALELVKRGHRLVADDAVEIRRTAQTTLYGQSPENIRHFIELRGIGIINARKLFGMGAIKLQEKIDMVINLEQWDSSKVYDRMGLDNEYMKILGVEVPTLTIPVKPGRNLAVIIEVAAMNNRQKKMGYNAARELLKNLGMAVEDLPPSPKVIVDTWE